VTSAALLATLAKVTSDVEFKDAVTRALLSRDPQAFLEGWLDGHACALDKMVTRLGLSLERALAQ
jgi:hypothetical protein